VIQTSSDPLEINRRREKRLQASKTKIKFCFFFNKFFVIEKNSIRVKKSAEFVNDDDEDESSMDIADTVEVMTTQMESKSEQV
jgi:hypothetical protein